MYQQDEQIRVDLNASLKNFVPTECHEKVIVTSIPKSGTHLLYIVLLHIFTPKFMQGQFVFYENVDSLLSADNKNVVVGHLPFGPEIRIRLKGIGKKMLLIRDPVDVAISQARAAFDPRDSRADYVFIRENLVLEDYIRLLMTGYEICGVSVGPFMRMMSEFAVLWSTTDMMMIDHAELIEPGSDVYERILDYLEIDPPADLAARVAAARSPTLSRSYLPPMPDKERDYMRGITRDMLEFYVPGVFPWYAGAREKMRKQGSSL